MKFSATFAALFVATSSSSLRPVRGDGPRGRNQETRRLGVQAVSMQMKLNCGPSKQAREELAASEAFRDSISADGLLSHLIALSTIATINHDNRFTGTEGYEDSATYVANVLEDSGLEVTFQTFDVLIFTVTGEPELVSESQGSLVFGEDFLEILYSPSGTASGPAEFVPNFGCDAAAFADFTPGNIAVISRGDCNFAEKSILASDAGAAGVIIYNDEERRDLFSGLLSAEGFDKVTVPVFSAPFSFLTTITEGETLSLALEAETTQAQSQNVIGDYAVSCDGPVILIGAHLDSLEDITPGINANGSGVAAVLEIAKKMVEIAPENNIRFAFWGVQSQNFAGSDYYVLNLSDEEASKIAMYLNVETIGSSNFMRLITASSAGEAGPIEQKFVDFFEAAGVSYVTADDLAQSDVFGFTSDRIFEDFGIPSSGLSAGRDGTKTEELAELFGGTAGESFDPCIRKACDDLHNVNMEILQQMTDSVAHTIYTFATMSDLDLSMLANP